MSFTARKRLRDFYRDGVGVQAVGGPGPVDADGRDDRHDVVFEQRLQGSDVDTLDLAGEEMIDAAEDARRVRDHGVRARAPQVVGGKPFENFVRHAVRGADGDIEGVAVGDARADEVGRE